MSEYLSEIASDKSRETGLLPRVDNKEYHDLRGDERVKEAIRQQPDADVRKLLFGAWGVYRAMLKDSQSGVVGLAEQRFFNDALSEDITVPPDYKALEAGASFPSNRARETAPIKGAETMVEAPMNQTASRYHAVVAEPGELKDL